MANPFILCLFLTDPNQNLDHRLINQYYKGEKIVTVSQISFLLNLSRTVQIIHVIYFLYLLPQTVDNFKMNNIPNISRISLALSPMYLSTIALDTTYRKMRCY